ncbi:MFS transporter [Leucobacter denitrificans]|uniref:MFS transporter n=1 Tax=Leucobacter denitrificans TaxID=683042 RepID=A0A7G9S4G5_9MICO|nr:MFS transporter [Leucobacter denitrificans]QNN62740.1 MFS transporter [Leucobacter denitrificans]
MSRTKSILPWVVWGTAVALYSIAIINRSSLSALGPAAQHHFDIDASVLATFPVIQLIVYAACQIPVGMLLDRFGPSVLIIIGAVMMGLGQVAMALVSDVNIAILARILVGAGDACTFICVMRMVPEWFHPRQIPTVSQLTGLVGQAGQLISVTPLALVVSVFGWATGFLGIVAVGLLFTILGFFVLRDAPGSRTLLERVTGKTGGITERSARIGSTPATAVMAVPPATEMIPVIGGSRRRKQARDGNPKEGFIGRMRRLLSIPGVRAAFWIHFVSPYAANTFLLLWGTPFLMGGLGLSAPVAGGLLSITVVSSMLSGLIMGPVSSRFVERRVWVVIGITLLIAVTWSAVIFWQGIPPQWLIIALLIIIPLGGPASMVAFEVARSHTPRSFAGLSTGTVNTGGFIATIIAVMSIGVVLDLQGAGSPSTYSLDAFQLAFAVQIPIWVLGLVMVIIESRRTKRWMQTHGRTLR